MCFKYSKLFDFFFVIALGKKVLFFVDPLLGFFRFPHASRQGSDRQKKENHHDFLLIITDVGKKR